jgi:hypothetical protein
LGDQCCNEGECDFHKITLFREKAQAAARARLDDGWSN